MADLRVGIGEASGRAIWNIVALVLILIANRLISPNFFSIRMVNGRLIGSTINILDQSAPLCCSPSA